MLEGFKLNPWPPPDLLLPSEGSPRGPKALGVGQLLLCHFLAGGPWLHLRVPQLLPPVGTKTGREKGGRAFCPPSPGRREGVGDAGQGRAWSLNSALGARSSREGRVRLK